jgi:hypothetical protein
MAEQQVAGDAAQPSAKRLGRIVVVLALQGLVEDFLDEVLGHRAVTGGAEEIGRQPALVLLDDGARPR